MLSTILFRVSILLCVSFIFLLSVSVHCFRCSGSARPARARRTPIIYFIAFQINDRAQEAQGSERRSENARNEISEERISGFSSEIYSRKIPLVDVFFSISSRHSESIYLAHDDAEISERFAAERLRSTSRAENRLSAAAERANGLKVRVVSGFGIMIESDLGNHN